MATILLIDDDELLRKALRHLLVALGHEVFEAADGKAGVLMFDPRRHELVITDIVMPEMEGMQVIMELRKRHRGVKVIAMSGGGLMQIGDYLQTAKLLGADALLAKPFSREDLEFVLQGVFPKQPSLVKDPPAEAPSVPS
jgi:CheY-like chemotaxis protein